MRLYMQDGARATCRLALSMYEDELKKAVKACRRCSLPVHEAELILSRSGLAREELASHHAHVTLTRDHRVTLAWGLALLYNAVEKMRGGEAQLEIQPDGPEARLAEIRTLAETVGEQLHLFGLAAKEEATDA